MGIYDKKGAMFMVNLNKSQINQKLMNELENRLFPIFKASYRYKNQSIENII